MTQTPLASGDAGRIDQLERTLAGEREARARAEASDKAKSELLATVSHEVRTPLGAIISMSELLLGTQLDKRQRHYADTLQQSGRALLSIVNEILDHSRPDAGQFELENVTFSFHELMASLRTELEARAGERNLACSVALADGFPEQLYGDPVRIRQVLNNLIDNALKFTGHGSVSVLAGYGRDGDDLVLRFEVRDTCIDLGPEQVSRLFEPYTQADNSAADCYGGAGLGLSVARKLAALMGGELGCESDPGSGSMFWFTARLREVRQQLRESTPGSPSAAAPPQTSPGTHGPLSGHVLIVEDNRVNQVLIGAYLDQFGLTHETAENGGEAVKKVAENHYDVVLMDIMMPVMDGLEAARNIRALEPPASKVPMIALTANAMKGDRENYPAAGMDGYLSKPLNASSLFSALTEFLPFIPEARAAQ